MNDNDITHENYDYLSNDMFELKNSIKLFSKIKQSFQKNLLNKHIAKESKKYKFFNELNNNINNNESPYFTGKLIKPTTTCLNKISKKFTNKNRNSSLNRNIENSN